MLHKKVTAFTKELQKSHLRCFLQFSKALPFPSHKRMIFTGSKLNDESQAHCGTVAETGDKRDFSGTRLTLMSNFQIKTKVLDLPSTMIFRGGSLQLYLS